MLKILRITVLGLVFIAPCCAILTDPLDWALIGGAGLLGATVKHYGITKPAITDAINEWSESRAFGDMVRRQIHSDENTRRLGENPLLQAVLMRSLRDTSGQEAVLKQVADDAAKKAGEVYYSALQRYVNASKKELLKNHENDAYVAGHEAAKRGTNDFLKDTKCREAIQDLSFNEIRKFSEGQVFRDHVRNAAKLATPDFEGRVERVMQPTLARLIVVENAMEKLKKDTLNNNDRAADLKYLEQKYIQESCVQKKQIDDLKGQLRQAEKSVEKLLGVMKSMPGIPDEIRVQL